MTGIIAGNSGAAPESSKKLLLDRRVHEWRRSYAFSLVQGGWRVGKYLLRCQWLALILASGHVFLPFRQGNTSSFPFRRTAGPFPACFW